MQVSLYMTTIVLQQALQIGTNVWLKDWATHNQETGDNGNLAWYLGIYAALGLGASFTFLLNGLLLYSLCVIRAAKVMHDGMFYAVMRSPMLFFGAFLPPFAPSLLTASLCRDDPSRNSKFFFVPPSRQGRRADASFADPQPIQSRYLRD